MEQVFGLLNQLLSQNPQTVQRKLTVKTYKVVPLSQRSGVLGNCDGLNINRFFFLIVRVVSSINAQQENSKDTGVLTTPHGALTVHQDTIARKERLTSSLFHAPREDIVKLAPQFKPVLLVQSMISSTVKVFQTVQLALSVTHAGKNHRL